MKTRQRGFTLYLLLGALAVFAVMAVTIKVYASRLDAKSAELEACSSRYAETLKRVNEQNKAVETLQADSEKRRKQAASALAKAREGQGKADSEIARLRGLSAAGLDCAGAVEQVKRGMGK